MVVLLAALSVKLRRKLSIPHTSKIPAIYSFAQPFSPVLFENASTLLAMTVFHSDHFIQAVGNLRTAY
jgi:hypothetical protein